MFTNIKGVSLTNSALLIVHSLMTVKPGKRMSLSWFRYVYDVILPDKFGELRIMYFPNKCIFSQKNYLNQIWSFPLKISCFISSQSSNLSSCIPVKLNCLMVSISVSNVFTFVSSFHTYRPSFDIEKHTNNKWIHFFEFLYSLKNILAIV